jgi:hypothetical protein
LPCSTMGNTDIAFHFASTPSLYPHRCVFFALMRRQVAMAQARRNGRVVEGSVD